MMCRGCRSWLKTSFLEGGVKLVRRQELPPEASISAEGAVELMKFGNAVISHGWLAFGHPDPQSKRRSDVKLIAEMRVFWDFLSLRPRLPRKK